MFRLWGKIWKDSRMVKDTVISLPLTDTRTHRIFKRFCLVIRVIWTEKPIWLDQNIREFQRNNKTRFSQDSFIEQIDFDYLEIQILDEE